MLRAFHRPELVGLWEKYSKTPFAPLGLAKQLGKDCPDEDRRFLSALLALAPQVQSKFGIDHPLLCDRLALEQATAKDLSLWKRRLWPAGAHLADFCCGMGGDSFWIPQEVSVTGIDLDPRRLAMYRTNTGLMGCERASRQENALTARGDWDFFQIDPARRSKLEANQRKTEAMTPSWPEIAQILPHYQGAAIKLSPGFPLEELPADADITYLGNRTDCRETLVTCGSLRGPEPLVRAVCLPWELEFSASRKLLENHIPTLAPLGKYLFEPNPVLVRSHLFVEWAKPLDLWQIDAQIAYLSGDHPPPASPWCTCFQVLDSCDLGRDRVRQMLKKFDIQPMSLKKRGVEVDPAAELKALGVHTGNPGILFYTRIQDRKVAILTQSYEKQ